MLTRILSLTVLCSLSVSACTKRDAASDSLMEGLLLASAGAGTFCGLSSDGIAMAGEVLLDIAGSSPSLAEELKALDPSLAVISSDSGLLRVQTERSSEWFKGIRGVRSAQRNFVYHMQATPDDALYADLSWPALIAAPAVWDQRSDCSSVVIAVIDSGIGLGHSEFAGRLWTNSGEIPDNGIDDDGNGFADDVHGWDFIEDDATPDDRYGHGTHVAGLIGAAGNNGDGVTGICWNARIMVLKVFDAAGLTTTDRVVRALDYAVENGASVINLSLGGTGGANGDLTYGALERARSSDVLVIAAAGNEGRDNDIEPFFPASYDLDNIIAVASSSSADGISSFSNYGAVSVDMAAPGESVLSTFPFLNGKTDFEAFDSIHDWSHVSASWRVEEVDAVDRRLCGLSDPSGAGNRYAANSDSMAYRQYDPEGEGPVRVSFLAKIDTEPLHDRFEVLWGTGSSAPQNLLTYATGPRFQTVGWIQYSFLIEESGPIQLGFRLKSNSSVEAEGVTVSALSLSRQNDVSAYKRMSGTSMATPLVAGAAALLRSADPGCSYSDIKNAILTGGRPAPAFAGKSGTGRILDLPGAAANGGTCLFP